MDKGAERAVGQVAGSPAAPVQQDQISAGTTRPASTAGHRSFAKPYAIEGISRFGSHLALRLWAVDATEFVRIIARIGGSVSKGARATTLFYARPDLAEKAPGAIGLTILLSDAGLQDAAPVEILLVNVREEVIVARGPVLRPAFTDFFAGIVYDIQRTGRPIEQRLLFDRTHALSDLLRESWGEYLAEAKKAFLAFGKSYRPASYSIITVFYKKPFLAGLYAFTSRILDVPPDAEVVLCFQQGALFQQQIDYLEGLFRLFQINHKFVLFEENVGFAAANNVGVENAMSARVVLVNPDICCDDPAIYATLADAAKGGDIYGATLLSDAEEVMHNGIELLDQTISFKSKAQRVLRTAHIGRHMPLELVEEGGVSNVEAVSGAIIAASRETWQRIGGMPEQFVFAHFEDIEFCRMAAKAGVGVKVYHTRHLIHLESYGSGEDAMLHAIKQVNSAIFNLGAR